MSESEQMAALFKAIEELSEKIESMPVKLAKQGSSGPSAAQASLHSLVRMVAKLIELGQHWDGVAEEAQRRSQLPQYDDFPAGYWLGVSFGLSKAAGELRLLVRQEHPELL